MVQKAHALDTRRDSSLKGAAAPRNGGFKPLGIPALAAAVQAASRQPRKVAHRDVPAILRDLEAED